MVFTKIAIPGQEHYLRTPLAQGGMSEVIHVEDRKARREWVEKIVPIARENPYSAARVENERVCSMLVNGLEGVVETKSAEYHPRSPSEREYLLIEMEYLRGASLLDYIEFAGPKEPLLELLLSVGKTLPRIHKRDVVHADLKPGNVRVTLDGVSKIFDFGIARHKDSPPIFEPGKIFGTPAYMTPEQVSDRELGPFTDYFAFGTMLYEVIVGSHPFCEKGAKIREVLLNIASLDIDTLNSLGNVFWIGLQGMNIDRKDADVFTESWKVLMLPFEDREYRELTPALEAIEAYLKSAQPLVEVETIEEGTCAKLILQI